MPRAEALALGEGVLEVDRVEVAPDPRRVLPRLGPCRARRSTACERRSVGRPVGRSVGRSVGWSVRGATRARGRGAEEHGACGAGGSNGVGRRGVARARLTIGLHEGGPLRPGAERPPRGTPRRPD